MRPATHLLYRAEHGDWPPTGDQRCWLCGEPCPPPDPADALSRHAADVVRWNKRFDDGLAQRALESGVLTLERKTKVQINSGEFKSYHMPLFLEHVERLVWYAVGDEAEVRRLLETHVHHVGKKRNAGHGVVAAWEVEPWDGPADRWLWREPGVPARAIPLDMLPRWDGETMVSGTRPPYWLAAHQVECAVAAEGV